MSININSETVTPYSASFFKVLLGDFSHLLRIPPDFVEYLIRKPPKNFILQCSTGRSWEVKVNKIGESWFFEDGWATFVSENFLEFGDFLVFTLDDDSTFHVQMFGKSGCEKKDEKMDDISIQSERTLSDQTNDDDSIDCVQSNKALTYDTPKALDEHLSLLCPCTRFIAAWRSSYSLSLPKVWVEGNKLSGKTLKLRYGSNGKPWKVTIKRRKDGHITLGSGWIDFCRDNKFEKGDVFVFNLEEKSTLQVFPFREYPF